MMAGARIGAALFLLAILPAGCEFAGPTVSKSLEEASAGAKPLSTSNDPVDKASAASANAALPPSPEASDQPFDTSQPLSPAEQKAKDDPQQAAIRQRETPNGLEREAFAKLEMAEFRLKYGVGESGDLTSADLQDILGEELKAAQLAPRNPYFHFKVAALAAALGDEVTQEHALAKAIGLTPDYEPPAPTTAREPMGSHELYIRELIQIRETLDLNARKKLQFNEELTDAKRSEEGKRVSRVLCAEINSARIENMRLGPEADLRKKVNCP